MKRWLTVITALSLGAIRGFHEGMIMSRTGDALHTGLLEGVRGHVGFGLYHVLGLLTLAILAVLAIQLYRSGIVLIVGTLVLIWGTFEIAYPFARYGTIPAYEHIAFADLLSYELHGFWVYVLHAVRFLIGSLLCWNSKKY